MFDLAAIPAFPFESFAAQYSFAFRSAFAQSVQISLFTVLVFLVSSSSAYVRRVVVREFFLARATVDVLAYCHPHRLVASVHVPVDGRCRQGLQGTCC